MPRAPSVRLTIRRSLLLVRVKRPQWTRRDGVRIGHPPRRRQHLPRAAVVPRAPLRGALGRRTTRVGSGSPSCWGGVGTRRASRASEPQRLRALNRSNVSRTACRSTSIAPPTGGPLPPRSAAGTRPSPPRHLGLAVEPSRVLPRRDRPQRLPRLPCGSFRNCEPGGRSAPRTPARPGPATSHASPRTAARAARTARRR